MILAAMPHLPGGYGPESWNRRYRENMERMKSGDLFEVASVVKGLTLAGK